MYNAHVVKHCHKAPVNRQPNPSTPGRACQGDHWGPTCHLRPEGTACAFTDHFLALLKGLSIRVYMCAHTFIQRAVYPVQETYGLVYTIHVSPAAYWVYSYFSASFTSQHVSLIVHFHCCAIFHRVTTPLHIYSFFCRRMLGWTVVFAVTDSRAVTGGALDSLPRTRASFSAGTRLAEDGWLEGRCMSDYRTATNHCPESLHSQAKSPFNISWTLSFNF